MRKETDLNGLDQHLPGAKLDKGKNRLALVLNGFSRALLEVGEVGTFGANKYTDNGWMEVENGISRYTDALYRHQIKEATGELLDDDSGLSHAAHAAWNSLARLELLLRAAENQESNLIFKHGTPLDEYIDKDLTGTQIDDSVLVNI